VLFRSPGTSQAYLCSFKEILALRGGIFLIGRRFLPFIEQGNMYLVLYNLKLVQRILAEFVETSNLPKMTINSDDEWKYHEYFDMIYMLAGNDIELVAVTLMDIRPLVENNAQSIKLLAVFDDKFPAKWIETFNAYTNEVLVSKAASVETFGTQKNILEDAKERPQVAQIASEQNETKITEVSKEIAAKKTAEEPRTTISVTVSDGSELKDKTPAVLISQKAVSETKIAEVSQKKTVEEPKNSVSTIVIAQKENAVSVEKGKESLKMVEEAKVKQLLVQKEKKVEVFSGASSSEVSDNIYFADTLTRTIYEVGTYSDSNSSSSSRSSKAKSGSFMLDDDKSLKQIDSEMKKKPFKENMETTDGEMLKNVKKVSFETPEEISEVILQKNGKKRRNLDANDETSDPNYEPSKKQQKLSYLEDKTNGKNVVQKKRKGKHRRNQAHVSNLDVISDIYTNESEFDSVFILKKFDSEFYLKKFKIKPCKVELKKMSLNGQKSIKLSSLTMRR